MGVLKCAQGPYASWCDDKIRRCYFKFIQKPVQMRLTVTSAFWRMVLPNDKLWNFRPISYFWKINLKNAHFLVFFCRYFSWVQTYFDVDVARCKCSTDMVDGALATMDLTLSKRDMIGFAPPVSRANGRSFWAIFLKIFRFWIFGMLKFSIFDIFHQYRPVWMGM